VLLIAEVASFHFVVAAAASSDPTFVVETLMASLFLPRWQREHDLRCH